MGEGANAIDAVFRIIGALRQLEARWNAAKDEHGRWFKDEDHPINLNIGKIEGGDWASSVPAWATIDCRIAIYPCARLRYGGHGGLIHRQGRICARRRQRDRGLRRLLRRDRRLSQVDPSPSRLERLHGRRLRARRRH
jgi:hypothetical protein